VLRRVLGAVGRALVTAGILILLFVAYQLWGTGYFEARAQDNLRDDFTSQLDTVPTTPTAAPEEPETTPSTAAAIAVPLDGDPVAIIRIPKIGVDKVVVEGTTVADLRKGPGHYAGTPLPGQIGNAAIAGHRTTYGAPFGDLEQLAEGDVIQVETLAGTFDYRVVESFELRGDDTETTTTVPGVTVVKPNQVEVLEPENPEDATLTLTTCNPKYSARERLVVRAELDARADQEPQAPTIDVRTPENLDAGLSGENTSKTATYLAGLIAALIGGLWWLIFHRYRTLVVWIVGAIPFAVALFAFYAYLERALPSNY